MRTYRIKEKGGRFFPQYKDGIITLWCWQGFLEMPGIVYPNAILRNYREYVFWDCETLQQATEIIEEDKRKRFIKIHRF